MGNPLENRLHTIILFLFIGIIIGYVAKPTPVRFINVTHTVNRTVIERVPVYIINQTTVIVEVPTSLDYFSSLNDLESFLEEDETNNQPYMENTFDCEDFAILLTKRAAEKGHIIWVTFDVLARHTYSETYIIGRGYYGIEPQTDELWAIGYADNGKENG